MTLRIRIKRHEIGLWFKNGDFERVLMPGVHWFPPSLIRPSRNKVEVFDTTNTRFEHTLMDILVGNAELREQLEVVELGEEQRAVVWKDRRLAGIIGPGRHAFWKRPAALKIDVFDVTVQRLTHPRLNTVVEYITAPKWLEIAEVGEGSTGLLFLNGRLTERLEQGRHAFWKGAGSVKVKLVDLREQVADVAGQEIMTGDKVTLRVNLVVSYAVIDPEAAVNRVNDPAQALYREAQLVLRAAVGARKLDELLTDKESVGNEVKAALASRAAEFGVVVKSVGLRDIILPGEMKTILNRVIEAQKAAEAELIKRREETAAARSQANTAKLLAENPVLARLKELELLQGVLAGTKATFIFGQGDLSRQVASLVSKPGDEPGT